MAQSEMKIGGDGMTVLRRVVHVVRTGATSSTSMSGADVSSTVLQSQVEGSSMCD